jgi:hypothetical protein
MSNESGDTPMTIEPTNRERGWQKRLHYLVDEELNKHFMWQTANCGDLMAASVLACHGPNHPSLKELTSGTEEDVKKSVAQRSGLDSILGKYFQSIPIFMAQDGDIATVGSDPSLRAGCVVLDGQLVGKRSDRGTYRLPISRAVVVYRV